MKLDWREWIREIAVGGLTGAAGGGVAALWTNQPVGALTLEGVVVALVIAFLATPSKWLVDWLLRRGTNQKNRSEP